MRTRYEPHVHRLETICSPSKKEEATFVTPLHQAVFPV